MTRSNDSQQNQENLLNIGLCCSIWPQSSNWKKVKKRDKYLELAKELKKYLHKKVTVIPIVTGMLGTVTKELVQRLEDLEISGDYPNYRIVEISQNTEKSPGDLRRLAVTQTLVEKQLTLVWKTLKWVKKEIAKIYIKTYIWKYFNNNQIFHEI